MKRFASLLPITLAVSASVPALAQEASGAGPSLQENARVLPRPASAGPVPVPATAPEHAPKPGGVRVTLRRIAISGNTRIPSPELLAALGPVEGRSFDFAGLNALAVRLTRYYQHAGFPFARAYLPQQDLSKGELTIQILEGRYGSVRAHGEPAFVPGAEGFLSALEKGALIENAQLERVTLLLNDQPGVRTVPVVRPGATVGSGDLDVEVERDHRFKGEAGIDNYGSRATGRARAHFNADADSPFMLGDQILLQALYTDEHMWFGSLAYAAPLGTSGLRAQASYTHSFYELSGSFADLGDRGTADVAGLGLFYPLVRSQMRNLTLSVHLDHKRLHDQQLATGTESDKSSTVTPVNLAFDVRDQFIYAGITFGAISWTHGSMGLDGGSLAFDSASARTAGGFSKLNLDLARIQSLNNHIDLYGRVSAQWAAANLDPSEKLGLGGVNGVRAYPNGEGYGDTGWLAQTELRYAVDGVVPFLFFDAGKVRLNKKPWAEGVNYRALAGGGLGMRWSNAGWSGDLALAWRTHGGQAQSEPSAKTPALSASASYRF